MALRSTRQIIEVLGTSNSGETTVTRQTVAVVAAGIGPVRVYRQMIEVLAGEPSAQIYEESLTSTLSLTQDAHSSLIQVSAISTLTATSTAVSEIRKDRFAESTIELTQDAYIKSEASSAIELIQSATFLKILMKTASSSLSPSQILDYDIILNRLATSPITVTQEAIYHGPIAASAITVIDLTGAARVCELFVASASSVLMPTHTAEASGTIRVSASNALSLVSLADRGVFNRSVSSELVLSQEAWPGRYYIAHSTIELTSTAVQGQIFGNAVSVLTLTQTARTNPLTAGSGPEYDIFLPATVIDLQQTVTSSIHMLTAQSLLSLADTLGALRPWHEDAVSTLQTVTQVFDPVTLTMVDVVTGLSDVAVVTKRIGTPFFIQHYLQLLSQASVVKIVSTALSASAESALGLGHSAYYNRTGVALNYLELLSAASADLCLPLVSLLSLTSEVSVNAVRSRLAESPIGMISSLSGILMEETNRCLYNYCPIIGEGASGAPTPPPATLDGPLSGVTETFQLLYPPTGAVTDSITLRTPNFGNKDRLSFNRILRETRGGTLIVYADPMWPKIQTLVLSFSGLKASEKDDLLEFMDTYLGLEIGLLDWEHRYWRGVIIAPDDPAVQDDRNSFSISFEFEGERDPTWAA